MKKILVMMIILIVSFSLFAAGAQDTGSKTETTATARAVSDSAQEDTNRFSGPVELTGPAHAG